MATTPPLTINRIIAFSIAILLILSACQLLTPESSSTPVTTPSENLSPTERAEIEEGAITESVAIPTETEMPEKPSVSQEDLIEKWRSPIVIYALILVTCDGAIETAVKSESGIIDGAQTMGEIFGAQLFLGITNEAVGEWAPREDLREFQERAQNHIQEVSSLIEQWSNDEITTTDYSKKLGEKCDEVAQSVEELASRAKAEGLTQDSIEVIAEDIQNSLSEVETEVEEEAEEVIPQEVGFSRQNPFPLGELVSAPNWDIQVIEVVRGEEAWQLIQTANSFNEPALEGMEYILVKIHAVSTAEDSEEHSISSWDFNLTGGRLIRYNPASVVKPDPELDARLFSGGETEGWLAFSIGQDEDNLILILSELANWEEDRFRFFTLEESASLTIPDEIRAIQPTELGLERSNPASVGEVVITEDWEVTLLESISGEEAWLRLQEANPYNEPLEEGMEYLLVKIGVRHIGVSDTGESIDQASFKSTGSLNVLYDPPSVVKPEPVLEAYMFPGGSYEGWLSFVFAVDETDRMVVFQPWMDWDDQNRRFLSIEP